jgi:hypothetical protein
MYFSGTLPAEYGVTPDAGLSNAPELLMDEAARNALAPEEFTLAAARAVAGRLGLAPKS